MTLATATWRACSVHEMYAAWLKGERHVFTEPKNAVMVANLLRDPIDFGDAAANHLRARFLFLRRAPILTELPSDTSWYEVHHLAEVHLDQLLVIGGNCGWDDPNHVDGNELRAAAVRKAAVEALSLMSSPDTWASPILWGHEKDGPLTIMEGNHRLAAYAAASTRPELKLAAFVGLSPSLSSLHFPDGDRGITGPLWPPIR
jgi:hypothetical protein